MQITSKICTKCGRILPAHPLYFYTKKEGFFPYCIKCAREKARSNALKRYSENKQKVLDKNKKYRDSNKKKLSKHYSEYRSKNKQKIKKQNANYYKTNKEIILEKNKAYVKSNKEHLIKYWAGYRLNPEVKEKENKVRKERYRSDSKYRINVIITNGIKDNLKFGKNGKSWLELVDFNVEELENRLRETIPEGHTWEDFLAGELHIDHIIPKSKFNYEKATDPDFKRAWCLDNLQLLPAKENLSKGAKLERPLQMGLIFG